MLQYEKRTCSACKTIAFTHKICRLVAFSFLSSLSLREDLNMWDLRPAGSKVWH